ncbi:hypothetical protein EUGRSUZ_L00390 [Eucalyptus grandis]|uniref:Uncharacterized protein n=1 Tax=Eucalyptus grandis TaxID=71139 RepID=A0A058ZVF4_EUCGR|nr:hypothetical protein EUGRSUZ_L00390 [Eucalyptus grandis]
MEIWIWNVYTFTLISRCRDMFSIYKEIAYFLLRSKHLSPHNCESQFLYQRIIFNSFYLLILLLKPRGG